jgi:hypothetical protein
MLRPALVRRRAGHWLVITHLHSILMDLPMAGAVGETAVSPLLAPTHFLFDAVDSLSKKHYLSDKWTGSIKFICLVPILQESK